MRSAEICHIGAKRNDTSLSTSTSVPPRPNIISGPNRASRLAPRITSTPLRAICSTRMPSIFASGTAFFTLSMDLLVGRAGFLAAVDVQDHAAGVELVDHVGRHHLHHHRRAERLGDPRGLVGALGDVALQQRQPIARQQRAALGLRQIALADDRSAARRRSSSRLSTSRSLKIGHLAAREFRASVTSRLAAARLFTPSSGNG